jgi:hypothetical protein
MTAEILSTQTNRGKTQVIYRFINNAGEILGPYVEHRPNGEDYTAWVEFIKPAEKVDMYATMQAVLDGNIGIGTYDVLRRALKDIGGQMVELNGTSVIEMNVTYPTTTLPEDVELQIKQRVDGEKGVGTLDAIKSVLRSMGLSSATIQRKSNLTL